MQGIAIAVGISILLASCASQEVRVAQVRTPRALQLGDASKPIQFRKVVARLRRGEPIGQVQVGIFCIPGETLEWRGGRANISDDEFTEIFKEELEKANYKVVGDPNALFEDPSAWKAELLVAGLINKIEANICFPLAGFQNFRDSKGAVFIRVHWQVYGQLERKVIYEVTTEGSYEAKESRKGGGAKLLMDAFAVAVQNLLADEGFHKLVLRSRGQTTGTLPAPNYETLRIEAPDRPLFGITDARAGAVTIFAGPGHGSGFIISPSGYVITNEHVVKQAQFVKVRLANGREVLGDVIRADAARDVALIKLREANLPALLVRLSPSPNVGEEVYAIGTPYTDRFDVTVSRGIVSAYRDEDGRKYIQSDVQVHPGNSGGPLLARRQLS